MLVWVAVGITFQNPDRVVPGWPGAAPATSAPKPMAFADAFRLRPLISINDLFDCAGRARQAQQVPGRRRPPAARAATALRTEAELALLEKASAAAPSRPSSAHPPLGQARRPAGLATAGQARPTPPSRKPS